MANVYEEFFLLKHHGGWSFFEAYNLPIYLRLFYLKRLESYYKEEAKEIKKEIAQAKKK